MPYGDVSQSLGAPLRAPCAILILGWLLRAVNGIAVEHCDSLRDETGQTPPGCGQNWALMNLDTVIDYWEVHELRLFWDTECSVPVEEPRDQFPSETYFSSPVITTAPTHTARKAFDENLTSMWTANCRMLQGGCRPRTTYVGKFIGELDPPDVAAPGEPPVLASIRCVQLWQSPDLTRIAREVGIIVWLSLLFGDWTVVQSYSAMGGGAWQTRPALNYQVFRVLNAEPTETPWRVSELLLYTDIFCTETSRATDFLAISHGSFLKENCETERTCNDFPVQAAFDGIFQASKELPLLGNDWVANCNADLGCVADQAWLGVDFGRSPEPGKVQSIIRCVRIFQPTHDGYPYLGSPHHSSALRVESWSFGQWRGFDVLSGRWIIPGLIPFTFLPGEWQDTRPEPNYGWRLSNVDGTTNYWEVHELAFYSQPDCGTFAIYDSNRGGTQFNVRGIASFSTNPGVSPQELDAQCSADSSPCATLAFDRTLATSWRSSCENCKSADAGLGLIFSRPQEIRCFRVWQSGWMQHLVKTVQLEYWDGEAWIRSRREDALGGGSWNYRPTMPRTAWRLLSLTDSKSPWSLAGVALHSDSNCVDRHVVPLGNTLPIASSHEGIQAAALAFDHDQRDPQRFVNETAWMASCEGINDTIRGQYACVAGEAWIGVQSGDAELEVQCVRLMQDRRRENQVFAAVLEYWDGTRWTAFADRRFDFSELGGGAPQSLPALAGGSWRFSAVSAPGSAGVAVSELAFYRTPTCEGHLEAKYPNVLPICSGYSSVIEVSDAVGDIVHMVRSQGKNHGANSAFDGDLSTMWAEMVTNGAWVGLEFLAQDAPIQCVKVALGQLANTHLAWAEIQGWNGQTWARQADARGMGLVLHPLVVHLPTVNGAGWQSPLAGTDSIWRLEAAEVVQAWHVVELAFYETPSCTGLALSGSPVASLSVPLETDTQGGHEQPGRAFDGDLTTRWTSTCNNGTCSASEAWVGLDVGARVAVRCFRLWQGARSDTKADAVALSVWTGETWVQRFRERGLAGGTWNQRPAPADSLWRLSWHQPGPQCDSGSFGGPSARAWSISELQFYSDDECKNGLPSPGQGADGPFVIVSGAPEQQLTRYTAIPARVHPANAFDGDTSTSWRAHCSTPREDLIGIIDRSASCVEGEEWVGVDYRMPVQVHCVRFLQRRNNAPDCCDPASELHLDRWNGTGWVNAQWRHVPSDGSQSNLDIQAVFGKLGECPTGGPLGSSGDDWVQRHRRQSMTCEVPLSGAVGLLADAICDKHDSCVEAGFTGECCPTQSSLSKCCCSYLLESKIFEDEVERDSDGRPLGLWPDVGLELFIIRSSQVLPYMGLFVAGLMWLALWLEEPVEGQRWKRLWIAFILPVQHWTDHSHSLIALVTRFFCRAKVPHWERFVRGLVWLLVGFVLGGASLGLLLGYMIAELFCRAFVNLSLVLKVAHPPIEVPVRERLVEPQSTLETVVNVLRGIVWSLVLMARAIFDFILLRFAAADVGMVNINLSVPKILENFPDFPLIDMSGAVDLIYDGMQYFAELAQEMFFYIFSGVPRCEGPVLLFSGTLIVMVVFTLVRWLNYDYFALFVAATHSVMRQRPMFQQMLSVVGLTILQAATFMLMQLVMLCLSRALVIANPIGNKLWMCPYGGETLAIILGKGFLWVAAILGMVFAILCANGHFLGQDYITKDISRKVGIDLSELDVDGGSSKHLRYGYYGSMLPTTLGIWIDGWNVKGYLIKERARIYAQQMKVPIICPYCKEQHVPYNEIIKVTGMQLSLNYQLAPLGALFGKACEYLNDPPSLYIGTSLKCYYAKPHVEMARAKLPRKKDKVQLIPAYCALGAAWLKDRFFPVCRRLLKVALYGTILWMVFGINESNLQKQARNGFLAMVGIAGSLGMVMFALPALIGLILAACLVIAVGVKKEPKPPTGKSFFPVVSETLHGVVVGMACVIYLQEKGVFNHEFDLSDAILVGTLAGVTAGAVYVALAVFLRSGAKNKMCGTVLLLGYALLIGSGGAFLSSQRLPSVHSYNLMVGFGLVVQVVTGLGLKDPPQPFPKILPTLLRWPRLVCAPYAIIVGVPIGGLLRDLLKRHDFLPVTAIEVLGHVSAAAVALPWACVLSGVADIRPAQWAASIGHVFALFLGYMFHWIVAPITMLLAGGIVGAFVEWLDQRAELRRRMMTEEELRRMHRRSTVFSSKVLEKAVEGRTQMLKVYGRRSSYVDQASDFDTASPKSFLTNGETTFFPTWSGGSGNTHRGARAARLGGLTALMYQGEESPVIALTQHGEESPQAEMSHRSSDMSGTQSGSSPRVRKSSWMEEKPKKEALHSPSVSGLLVVPPPIAWSKAPSEEDEMRSAQSNASSIDKHAAARALRFQSMSRIGAARSRFTDDQDSAAEDRGLDVPSQPEDIDDDATASPPVREEQALGSPGATFALPVPAGGSLSDAPSGPELGPADDARERSEEAEAAALELLSLPQSSALALRMEDPYATGNGSLDPSVADTDAESFLQTDTLMRTTYAKGRMKKHNTLAKMTGSKNLKAKAKAKPKASPEQGTSSG